MMALLYFQDSSSGIHEAAGIPLPASRNPVGIHEAPGSRSDRDARVRFAAEAGIAKFQTLISQIIAFSPVYSSITCLPQIRTHSIQAQRQRGREYAPLQRQPPKKSQSASRLRDPGKEYLIGLGD